MSSAAAAMPAEGVSPAPVRVAFDGEKGMPVRSVLYLPVKPGRQADLVAVFARIDVLGHAMQQAGCLGVEVQVEPDAPEASVLVIALWTDRAAYDGWLANPWRAESAVELAPCLRDEPGAGAVYDVVLATDGAIG